MLRQSVFAKRLRRTRFTLRVSRGSLDMLVFRSSLAAPRVARRAKRGAPGRQSPISLTIRIYGDFSHGLLPIPAEIPAS